MAWVNPKIVTIIAHEPETTAAVRRARDRLADIVRAEFVSHDRPGGHEITTTNDAVDALVSLEGPAPLSVEFGHWSGQGENRRYVEGLHLFSKGVTEMEAEGRL